MNEIRGRLISLFYTTKGNKLLLHWIIRNEKGKNHIITPSYDPPYAFVDAQYIDAVRHMAKRMKYPVTITKEENARFMQKKGIPYRVTAKFPKHIGNLNSALKKINIKLHEADILYSWRVTVDSGIKAFVRINLDKRTYHPHEPSEREKNLWKPHVAFWDIETSYKAGKNKRVPNPTDDKIISVGANNNFFCYDEERETVDKAWDYLKKHDFLVDWNGKNFDQPFLRDTCKRLKLRYNFKTIQFIDYMKSFIYLHREVNSKIFFGLNEAGRRFADISKFFIKENPEYYFNNDRNILKQYNLKDVEIIQKLDQKYNFVKVLTYISESVGVPVGDMVYISRIPLLMYLREAVINSPRIIVPCSPTFKEGMEEESYVGGRVFATIPGLHEDVFAMDLAGSYVNIIRTFNCSPEMWDDSIGAYGQDEDGIVRRIITRLGDRREYYKSLRPKDKNDSMYGVYDILQYSVKVMQLTFYGELGRGPTKKSPTGSRLFIRKGAEFITKSGRMLVEKGSEAVKRLFRAKLIYGDTDSIYFTIPILGQFSKSLIEGTLKEMEYVINRFYRAMLMDRGIPEDHITVRMEVQGYYPRFYITEAKKKYIYYLGYDGEKWYDPYIFGFVGMDFKRRETIKLIATNQKKVCRMILNKVHIDKIVRFIKGIRSRLYKGKMNNSLIFSYNLTKSPDKYKGNAPYIRAGRIAQDLGEHELGNIEYVVNDYKKKEIEVYPVIRGNFPDISKSAYGYYWGRVISTMQNTLEPLINSSELEAKLLGKELLVV